MVILVTSFFSQVLLRCRRQRRGRCSMNQRLLERWPMGVLSDVAFGCGL